MSIREKAAEAANAAMVNKLVGLIFDGIGAVVFAVWGILSGSFATVWAFASANPYECAIWCGVVFFVGAFIGLLLSRLIEFGKRARRVDLLRRSFMYMSPRRKAIVAVALHDGAVRLPDLDTDAATLCELGILGMPPFGLRLANVDYSIQPAVADIMRKHGREWLGDMDIANAYRTIWGDES